MTRVQQVGDQIEELLGVLAGTARAGQPRNSSGCWSACTATA